MIYTLRKNKTLYTLVEGGGLFTHYKSHDKNYCSIVADNAHTFTKNSLTVIQLPSQERKNGMYWKSRCFLLTVTFNYGLFFCFPESVLTDGHKTLRKK